MSLYGLLRTFAHYLSDDTNTYVVGTTIDNATAGNLPVTTNPTDDPALPRGYVMRHVYAVAGDGTRTKIPIGTPTDALYVTGGSFTKNGKTFTIEGRIGEKRSNRN
jgi:hypothetical protein